MQLPMIKCLDDCNDINCIDRIRAWICENGDQHMLLEVEWPGIQRERPFCSSNFDGFWREVLGHELADWKSNNLGWDGRNVKCILPVPKELVRKCESYTTNETEYPCSKCQCGYSRVISDWYSQSDFLNWTIICFICKLRSIDLKIKIETTNQNQKPIS